MAGCRAEFQYGSSTSCSSAADVNAAGRGVCRDFTHLAISFCRALNIPARYVFGYLPYLDVPPEPAPMDFAAWMEVWLGDRWWTFDPRKQHAAQGAHRDRPGTRRVRHGDGDHIRRSAPGVHDGPGRGSPVPGGITRVGNCPTRVKGNERRRARRGRGLRPRGRDCWVSALRDRSSTRCGPSSYVLSGPRFRGIPYPLEAVRRPPRHAGAGIKRARRWPRRKTWAGCCSAAWIRSSARSPARTWSA